MPSLKGTETEQNLKQAFAGESQASRRYLYFAQKADVEGFNDVAAVFRSTAEGETRHAHGNRERDPRIPRRVSGHGARGPPGRLRRDRRLVRDACQGREVACRALPKGARRKLEHDRRETWSQKLMRKRASARSCTGPRMSA